MVQLPGGAMRVRIHRPTDAPNPGVLIYLHGGGFMFFSIDTHDRVMREYAARTDLVVMGLDYPLAPESRFPVALERIVEFVAWLVDHAEALGIDADRIAIGGDSAGGNLSVATALALRDSGRPGIVKALLLNYPGLSPDKSPEAAARFGGSGAILSAEEADFFWDNYLRGREDRQDPRADILLADPAGLPPAIFIVAESDLLAEQSPVMAERMVAAGGSAVLRIYPGAVHGFIEAVSISDLADRAIGDAAEWLRSLPAMLPARGSK
jgi:acetyl esterase